MIEWTEKQKQCARMMERGDGISKLQKAKVHGGYKKIKEEMERIKALSLPRPWDDGHQIIEIPAENPREDKVATIDNKDEVTKRATEKPPKGGAPAQAVQKTLFEVVIKGEKLIIKTEDLIDIFEVYWAFKENGYNGTPLQLAKRCMIKWAQVMDIRPKLYMEVLTGDN